MISKKGKPISGGAGQFGFTPNVPTNAADTSRDAMKKLKGSPQPFQNSQGILGVPAPTNPNYRANANFAKDGLRYGGVPKSVSVRSKPTVDFKSVGYAKPYSSNRGIGPVNSGFPQTGVQRVVGPGSFPKATSGPKFRPGQAKNYPSLRGGYKG